MDRTRLIDAIGPATLIAVGIAFAAGSWLGLDLGTMRRLGPGALPLGLGVILAILGITILSQIVTTGTTPVPRPDLRALAAVGVAIATFALLTERMGLLPAVFGSVVAMTTVIGDLGWPGRIALALCIAIGVWVIFILGLRLPIRTFGG
ncbi:tripartite tricarboxylate transporter TctB family protein [Roseicitreum antarcticum]|uniref:Tripartite tricarboxylate transporter TctB family protein n=1 Tax=Roseicitreum antarcticum TaxID=564137 RepID=A0A1H2TMI2_9RHOB|nr:tripartite tricarboxylate transporter TctB family protein [Roseicitreum antarcticum]SDW44474.1 Tripartite tricarboxylate transporter TctB family protein [Roseicitreum antarcticum]